MGAAAIVISFAVMGVIKSAELSKRVYVLRQFIKAVEESRDLISYTSTEASIVISKIKYKYPNFYGENTFKNDKFLIDSFFHKLGSTNTEGQINLCNGIINEAQRLLAEAEKDKNEKSKLYTTLGICAGLSLSVILI